MYEWEASLIDRLNDRYPGWRELYPDPFTAAEVLIPELAEWLDSEDPQELRFDDE